jgi:DNA (cytosine-5)-methyltransferase 1
MTIGSLFSGIGGLELGLEAAGLGPVLFQVEIDPFASSILAKHWPDAQRFSDVRTVGKHNLPRVDVLCGGFPCQDISFAGKGAGLEGARSGLWFEYLRVISEIQPRYVVIENVAGLVRRGLDVVVSGLHELGYEVEGTRLQAADVGAPHRRERLFLVAVARTVGRGTGLGDLLPRREEPDAAGRGEGGGPGSVADPHREGGLQQGGPLLEERGRAGDGGDERGLGHPNRPRLEGWGLPESGRADERSAGSPGGSGTGSAEGSPEPGLGRDAARISGWMDTRWPAGRGQPQYEWEPPRTIPPRSDRDRSRRLKALGNAVVPQCAEVVGWRVRQLMTLHDTTNTGSTICD